MLVGLTGLYFLSGRLGLGLALVHPSASAVWPPTGIALAAAILFGSRVWPAILVGAFLVNVTTAGSVVTSFGIATGNTLEAVVGAFLVQRYAGGTAVFERPRGVFRFALLAAGASTAISATIGVASLTLGGLAAPERLAEIWLTWWLGDAIGALVFTPFIVVWAAPGGRRFPRRGALETVALAGALAAAGALAFQPGSPLSFLTITPLVWAAFRFGRRGAMTASVVLSTLALIATFRGGGFFPLDSPNDSLLYLQTFLGTMTLTALVLASVTRERERVEEALQRAGAELESRVVERTASLRRAVDDLEESRAMLAEAQRVAHVGSWQWEVAGDRLTWSDELYRIYGLEGSVPVSYATFLERVHPADREATATAIRAALEGDDSFAREERIVRPDGEIRTLQSNGRVQRDGDGRPHRLIGTCHDITERKETERELERRMTELARSHAELTIFTHAASHDLKEPLRTVASNVQLIERRIRGVEDGAMLRSIAFAVEGVRRLEALIGDLLDYSRADRPSERVADAEAALAEAMSRLTSMIDETGTRVVAEPLPPVTVDPGRLVQLFQNLIANAIKYRDPGRIPEIRVSARRRGDMWEFDVADNGRGFDRREADRIFVVFERLHQDHEVPGTGLGLAICRRIVEAQGGRIQADSEPGRGSVFHFTLPRASDADPAAKPTEP